MIVDVKKLERVREAVDLSVVRVALERTLPRRTATCLVAHALGYRIRMIAVSGRWIAYAVPEATWGRASDLAKRGNAIQAAGTELLERLPWHYEAASVEDAMLAVVCRLIDTGVDLGQSLPWGAALAESVVAGQDLRGETPMSRWFGPVRDQWGVIQAAEEIAADAGRQEAVKRH